METKRILIKNIIENQNNPRSEIGDTSDLEASIKAHGLIQPIVVRWNIEKALFEVVAGSRRLQALRNIGSTEIDCIVNNSDDYEELFKISTAENITRKNMTPADECRAVLQMVRNGGDIRSIATEFGHSVRWAMGRLKMAELGEDILTMVDDGDITLAHAEVLTMCSNDEQLKKFAESCRYTQSEDLKKRILNEKKNLSKAPFDVKKNCKSCRKQTICQQDIFGDIAESYCEDGECFQKHLDAFLESKRQELKKSGYREYEGNWAFDFKHSYRYINPDKLDEEDIETVERIKANGGKMWFMLEDDGTVTFRWDREDDPKSEEEEEAKEQERNEREMAGKVRDRANALEKADFGQRLQDIVGSLGAGAAAVFFDYINRQSYDDETFGESSTVDGDEEENYSEGAVANLEEPTSSGKAQREYIYDKLIGEFFGYDGCVYKSEAERAFWELKPREEYERQARELIENEPEEEAETENE